MIYQFITITEPLLEIGIRFAVNIISIFVLVGAIYNFAKKDEEYSFTFYLFNILVFFVCYLMQSIEVSIGFGFGLFAIFSILRYRTDTIPIKEMTYLFTAITISLINAIAKLDWIFIFMNLAILLSVFLMEKKWFKAKENSTTIQYERLDLLGGDPKKVIEDIQQRTNLKITRFKVKSYNFLNDSAILKIYFIPSNS